MEAWRRREWLWLGRALPPLSPHPPPSPYLNWKSYLDKLQNIFVTTSLLKYILHISYLSANFSYLSANLKGTTNFYIGLHIWKDILNCLFSGQLWNDRKPVNGNESNEQRRRWHMGKVTNHLRTHIQVQPLEDSHPSRRGKELLASGACHKYWVKIIFLIKLHFC